MILFVSEMFDLWVFAERLIRIAGIEARCAVTCDEALELAHEHQPRIVVIDPSGDVGTDLPVTFLTEEIRTNVVFWSDTKDPDHLASIVGLVAGNQITGFVHKAQGEQLLMRLLTAIYKNKPNCA